MEAVDPLRPATTGPSAVEVPPGLEAALSSALGMATPPPATSVRVRPVDHTIDNMTTAALLHVDVVADATTVHLFAKVLQPADRSPLMAHVPPEHHASVMGNLDWLDEPRVYRSGIGADLPDGLRLPVVHHIAESSDEIALWLESVDVVGSWDLDGYRSAARLLGGAAARWPEERLRDRGIGRRSYEYLFFGKLLNVDVPVLRRSDHWDGLDLPSLGVERLAERTEALVAAAPRLLEVMRALPHGLAHGDATPHNLLPTRTGELVAVDWSYGCADALGADLGQLLAGRFDLGEGDPAEVPVVADAVLAAYLEGLAGEGAVVDEATIVAGFAIALAFRSVISATAIDHRSDLAGDARGARLARRVAVAEVGLDLLERAGLLDDD